jgi:hypothetical protein
VCVCVYEEAGKRNKKVITVYERSHKRGAATAQDGSFSLSESI